MKKLLIKTVTFFTILFAFFAILYFLPATPKSKCSLLFADLDKKVLLNKDLSNRIIFIGGSNLSFGLNCQLVKDSLGFNPVNTSIHAGLGLFYMLENYKTFLKSGDIVVVSPEYEQFFGDYAYGEEVLVRTILDVNRNNYNLLQFKHYALHLGAVPKILLSKLNIDEYTFKCEGGFYERNSFNQYGDVDVHWNTDFSSFTRNAIQGDYNYALVDYLKKYKNEMVNKGVEVYITFPCYESKSFAENIDKIKYHEREIIATGIELLGTPERYCFDKSFCFNSPYHLNRSGVEMRTNLLISDLQLKKNIIK
jgi:hypothetical protein